MAVIKVDNFAVRANSASVNAPSDDGTVWAGGRGMVTVQEVTAGTLSAVLEFSLDSGTTWTPVDGFTAMSGTGHQGFELNPCRVRLAITQTGGSYNAAVGPTNVIRY